MVHIYFLDIEIEDLAQPQDYYAQMNIFQSPEVESKILSDTVFLGWMLKAFKF